MDKSPCRGQLLAIFSSGHKHPKYLLALCTQCSVTFGSISVLFSALLRMSHLSQEYLKMDMTKKRISFCFGSRNILLSLQTDISFVSAAVDYAISERTLDFEPSSGYLKLVTLLMPQALCVISLISSARISI